MTRFCFGGWFEGGTVWAVLSHGHCKNHWPGARSAAQCLMIRLHFGYGVLWCGGALRRESGGMVAIFPPFGSLLAVHSAAHNVCFCAGLDVVHKALSLLRFEQGEDRGCHGAGHLGVIINHGFQLASPEGG